MTKSVKINVNPGVLTLQQSQIKELKELRLKVNLMKKLSSSKGFYLYYFSNLKNYESFYDCFENVNKLYFNLFGENRYSSYGQFRNKLSLA